MPKIDNADVQGIMLASRFTRSSSQSSDGKPERAESAMDCRTLLAADLTALFAKRVDPSLAPQNQLYSLELAEL
jgi:hypothetical protein